MLTALLINNNDDNNINSNIVAMLVAIEVSTHSAANVC
jgi:hypothetical protein